jgi:hypothetical protein
MQSTTTSNEIIDFSTVKQYFAGEVDTKFPREQLRNSIINHINEMKQFTAYFVNLFEIHVAQLYGTVEVQRKKHEFREILGHDDIVFSLFRFLYRYSMEAFEFITENNLMSLCSFICMSRFSNCRKVKLAAMDIFAEAILAINEMIGDDTTELIFDNINATVLDQSVRTVEAIPDIQVRKKHFTATNKLLELYEEQSNIGLVTTYITRNIKFHESKLIDWTHVENSISMVTALKSDRLEDDAEELFTSIVKYLYESSIPVLICSCLNAITTRFFKFVPKVDTTQFINRLLELSRSEESSELRFEALKTLIAYSSAIGTIEYFRETYDSLQNAIELDLKNNKFTLLACLTEYNNRHNERAFLSDLHSDSAKNANMIILSQCQLQIQTIAKNRTVALFNVAPVIEVVTSFLDLFINEKEALQTVMAIPFSFLSYFTKEKPNAHAKPLFKFLGKFFSDTDVELWRHILKESSTTLEFRNTLTYFLKHTECQKGFGSIRSSIYSVIQNIIKNNLHVTLLQSDNETISDILLQYAITPAGIELGYAIELTHFKSCSNSVKLINEAIGEYLELNTPGPEITVPVQSAIKYFRELMIIRGFDAKVVEFSRSFVNIMFTLYRAYGYRLQNLELTMEIITTLLFVGLWIPAVEVTTYAHTQFLLLHICANDIPQWPLTLREFSSAALRLLSDINPHIDAGYRRMQTDFEISDDTVQILQPLYNKAHYSIRASIAKLKITCANARVQI